MNQRKLVTNLVWIAIVAAMLIFFLEPRHEYISKLIYVLVLAGYGFHQYRQRNLRAVIICAIGTLFLLLTLPGFRTISEIGVLLSIVGWGVLIYLAKRQEKLEQDE